MAEEAAAAAVVPEETAPTGQPPTAEPTAEETAQQAADSRFAKLQERYGKLEGIHRAGSKQLKDAQAKAATADEWNAWAEKAKADPFAALQERFGVKPSAITKAMLAAESAEEPTENDDLRSELAAIREQLEARDTQEAEKTQQAQYGNYLASVDKALQDNAEQFPMAHALGQGRAVLDRMLKHSQEYGNLTPADQSRIAGEVESQLTDTVGSQVKALLQVESFREMVKTLLAGEEKPKPDQQVSAESAEGQTRRGRAKPKPKTLTNGHASEVSGRAKPAATAKERRQRALEALTRGS